MNNNNHYRPPFYGSRRAFHPQPPPRPSPYVDGQSAISRSFRKKKAKRHQKSFCAGASVLIVRHNKANGDWQVVLGKDSMGSGHWSDFGGGAQRREKDHSCAAREVAEETHGIFSDLTSEALYQASKVVFRFPSKKNPKKMLHYTTFVVALDVPKNGATPLDAVFQQARAALPEELLAREDRAEKEQVALVDLQAILSEESPVELRSFFKQRLQHLLPLIPQMLRKHTVRTVALGK